MEFDGVVVTDWGGNNDRVEGLKCMNSLEMPTTVGETNREIVKAIKDGNWMNPSSIKMSTTFGFSLQDQDSL